MDNQINPQEPVNQELPKEEIIPQEPVIQETPILETQVPEPELPSNEPTVPSVEYQKILDDYATTVKPQPEPELEPQVPLQEKLQDLGISNPPSTNNIFKIIFTIALIIFILVIIALGFTYFKSQKNSSTIDDLSSKTSSTPTPISTAVCSLNDKTYKVGESFPSADGCNTCSCATDLNIVCTEKACAVTSTKTATTSTVPKDWKTYTDSTYKYSVKYPSTWTTKNSKTNITQISTVEDFKNMEKNPTFGPKLTITTYNSLSEASNNSSKVKTLKDLAVNMTDPPEKNYKEITIGGVSGFTVTTDYPDTRIYLQKGNFIYVIFDGSLDSNSIEKQIINTLKFN